MLNSNQIIALHILFIMIMLELILYHIYRKLLRQEKELKRAVARAKEEQLEEAKTDEA